MAEEPTERTSFIEDDAGKSIEVTVTRRMRIENNDGEHSLHSVLVIEDFRAGYYLTIILIHVLGIVLTKVFTKNDYDAIIKSVYGITNNCVYLDFPPSTYILPITWCFAIIFGFLYSATAMLRIRIAHLENKLSHREALLLYIAYVYVALSIVLFTECFAVQPDPEEPVTMVVHTFPYINLKVMSCVLQVVVTYFGVRVSWTGLKLPRWFSIASVVHAIAYIIDTIFAFVWMVNALGDMGEKSLVGKGLWWSVRSKGSKVSGQIMVNILGNVLGLVLPLIQALFISRNGVNSHALIVAVSDNRVAAYPGQ